MGRRPHLFPDISRGKEREPHGWLAEHSLSLFLVLVMLVQSVAYWFAELPDWTADQRAHGGGSTALWPDYWLHYVAEYLVSIVADTYGALLLVLASKWFFEKGSAESKK